MRRAHHHPATHEERSHASRSPPPVHLRAGRRAAHRGRGRPRRGTARRTGVLPCPDRAEVGRQPPNLARRQVDRVFGDHHGLGGQPVRPGDLAGSTWTANPSNSPAPKPGAASGTAGLRTGPASASSRTAVTASRSTSSPRRAARPSGSLPTTAASGRSAFRPTVVRSRSRPPTPLPTTSRGARKATATTPSKTRTSACPTSG